MRTLHSFGTCAPHHCTGQSPVCLQTRRMEIQRGQGILGKDSEGECHVQARLVFVEGRGCVVGEAILEQSLHAHGGGIQYTTEARGSKAEGNGIRGNGAKPIYTNVGGRRLCQLEPPV